MSIVPKETIEVIVQSIGISNFSPDVALAVAPDVEYRLLEIMQEAIKCMRHSKRTVLTTDDVDSALSLRNVELYFDKITELTVSKPESVLFKKALVSLATDSGLHPLVPYFSYFIMDEVPRSLNDLPILFALMRVVQSLLRNPHIHIEPYLHQLMPSMITCLVAKRLGQRIADNHWGLRDFSANLVASVCKRFGNMYHNLQSKLTKTLLHAFLDPSKAMTQHYGAIQGLSALGTSVVRLLILPNLETYLQLLEPEMLLEKQKNEMKRKEAWRVYGALLCAAGKCLYDMLKVFPGMLSPPTRPIWKSNGKVATAMPNKRKAASNHTLLQPPLKRIAIDGTISSMPPMSMPSADGFIAASDESGVGPSTSSGQVSNENSTSGSRREMGISTAQKMHTSLAQAWKDDVDAGRLLASLFDLFGERILSFIQPSEMSLFI